MKTMIIFLSLLLFLIISPTKAQEWEFVGLDSLVIQQIFISGDTIWAGTISRLDTNKISGLYRSINKGVSWVRLDSTLGDGTVICSYVDLNSEDIWLGKIVNNPEGGTLFKSSNRGQSWQLINQMELIPIDWLIVSPFNKNEIYARESHYIIAGWYETVYRSTDGGTNWNEITYLPASSHGRYLTFNLSLSDSNKLYAAVDDQLGNEYFYVSTNKGDSWKYVSEPLGLPSEVINDTELPGRIYMEAWYISEDEGYTWELTNFGLSDTSYYRSFYESPYKSEIYTLRSDGLYKSDKKNFYWNRIDGTENLPLYIGNGGFSFLDIGALKNIVIDTINSIMYLGTAKGIYQKNLITDVNEITESKLFEYILYQNHPNPFNPTTAITFQILENSFVTLKVFDILGNEINTLVAEEKLSGKYQITFDGSALSSGVYFYVLTALTENGLRIREGKKMLLIK
jgi:hypothetical protein